MELWQARRFKPASRIEPNMYLSRKQLSRRFVLKGLGASIALPMLEAMAPTKPKVRLVCIEMVHGAAGSSNVGAARHLWSPEAVGRDFDLSPTSLRSLEPFRDALTIVSNTDVANAEPFVAREIGGDHYRSSAVFLTQAHTRLTRGSDVKAGTSIDQLYAQRVGMETPIPSMQLCIEDSGSCSPAYSCVYTDCLSWASPTKPLPMIRNPRVVFDELFGVFGTGSNAAERRARRAEDRSILDWVLSAAGRLKRDLAPADRVRLDDYFDNVREIERRIQAMEAAGVGREPGEIPAAPAGIPKTFTAHVQMMFDLQALAFASDITRVFSFKLGRDNSNRVYPESGLDAAFHPASHHGGQEDRVLEFAKLNAFHVGMLPYFLEKLKRSSDGDGSLLDNTIVLYGSPMGDSNEHNHKRVPFFIAGHGGGAIKGGLHIQTKKETPLANAMLGVLHALGNDDVTEFGDSSGALDLNAVA
jgi:hypothetical protein